MFTKILYINLDRRDDRNNHVLNELNKIKWTGKTERISGVDGKTLDLDSVKNLLTTTAYQQADNKKKINFSHGMYMTRGAVGCALSHRKAWINILNGDDDYVLILEDDIVFNDNFNDKIKSIENYDYDLLYLGYHGINNSNNTEIIYGMFGYIVNKRIAKLLIDMFPIDKQIDTEISKIYPLVNYNYVDYNNKFIHSDQSHINKLGTNIQLIENFNNTNNLQSTNYIIFIILFILFIFIFNELSNANYFVLPKLDK